MALSSEDQHALAAPDTEDQPALGEDHGDRTRLRARRCAKPAAPAITAARARRVPKSLIFSFPLSCSIDLMSQDHREITEHRKQDARDGLADREPDPGHRALDVDRGLAEWAGMRPSTGNAAHQHGPGLILKM